MKIIKITSLVKTHLEERHDYDSAMAHDTILSSPRSLLLNRIEEQARSRMARGPTGSMATFLVFLELPLQLKMQCVSPRTLGVAAAASPHRKSTTGYKRWEAIQPQLQNHANTHCFTTQDLLKRKKIQPTKRDLYQRTHIGTRLSGP